MLNPLMSITYYKSFNNWTNGMIVSNSGRCNVGHKDTIKFFLAQVYDKEGSVELEVIAHGTCHPENREDLFGAFASY